MAIQEPASPILTCPTCGSVSFQPISAGILFKSIEVECQKCFTRLRPPHKGEIRYVVAEVGKAYSNCEVLLKGMPFTRDELAAPDLPIYTDLELIDFGKGNIPEDLIIPDDLTEPPFELADDEHVMLQMDNVYSWEDRLHAESAALRLPVEVEEGEWKALKGLNEPTYAHNLETLITGILTITNRRLMFAGESRLITIPYSKAVRILPYTDGLGMTSPERNRIELFKGNYHWPLIFSVVKGLSVKALAKAKVK